MPSGFPETLTVARALGRSWCDSSPKGTSTQIYGICPKPSSRFLIQKPYIPNIRVLGTLGAGWQCPTTNPEGPVRVSYGIRSYHHTYTYTCVFLDTYTSLHIYTYVYTYKYIYACINIEYIYIYLHMYIHICTEYGFRALIP